MKLLIVALLTFFSLQALSCECSKWPLDVTPVMSDLLVRVYPEHEVKLNRWGSIEVKTIKAYPSVFDKLIFFLEPDLKQSSCHVFGPNKEDLFHCSPSYKRDSEVTLINNEGGECKVLLRLKGSSKKISAKILSSDC